MQRYQSSRLSGFCVLRGISVRVQRRENGGRHEVEFGDAPVRVEIYASEETVEIFIERISRLSKRVVGASPF
jgi:hypothetical protein